MPNVSVVIKTKDNLAHLHRSLPMIARQTISPLEVMIVDSGSQDGSKQFAQESGAQVLELDPSEFCHAKASNMGVRATRGEIIAHLSGDAVPTNEHWLEKLVSPFAHRNVAGVYGRQQLGDTANPLDHLRTLIRYKDRSRVQAKGNPIFSHVNSAFRRDLFEFYPFDENLPWCEDFDWACQMQHWGYSIYYEPKAAVYHSNALPLLKDLDRIIRFWVLRRELLRKDRPPCPPNLSVI